MFASIHPQVIILYKISTITNLNLFLVAVNPIISYFRYVIQNSVCVVVGTAKGGFLHKDLVESLRTVRKN